MLRPYVREVRGDPTPLRFGDFVALLLEVKARFVSHKLGVVLRKVATR
jgi:hypothetical protein